MPRTLAVGGAVLAASLAAASLPVTAPAVAATTTLSFDHVVLDTPGTGDQPLVSPSTQPLTITADVDPSTGAFSVEPTGFSLPAESTPEGSATVTLKDAASGAIDFATGAVTLTADFLATVAITGAGSCTVDTGPQTLTTATTVPLTGRVFPVGPTGFATGAGALGVGWSTLPAGTGTACSFIDPEVDGPGGLWISRGISPAAGPSVSPPRLSAKVAKPATVKAGRTATVKVTFANRGGADPSPVTVCLVAKAPLAPTRRCARFTPGAGSSRKLAFPVRTARAKPGTAKLTLTATGLKPQTVALKITR